MASPVLPVLALLLALPPFALFSWFCFAFPLACESLSAVALDEAVELPEVALPEVLDPEPSLLDLLFASPLVLLALPDEAVELLPFVALPLPDMFWLTEPPLPPVAELSAGPGLPDFALAFCASSPLYFVFEELELPFFWLSPVEAFAFPVGPEEA